MTSKQIKSKFDKIFQVLIKGKPEEYKKAKRDIEKLWHRDSKLFQKNAPYILKNLDQFDQIKSVKNQAAFVSGLNMFFLSLGDEHFETLKNFTLKTIQNPSGHVREAIRKTADWLYISLSDRISPSSFGKIAKKKKEEQEKIKKIAQGQYITYLREIEDLIEKYAVGEKNNVKYINNLKPSVYKSLQLLWSDLTRDEHLNLDENPTKEILAKREEIENKLVSIINVYGYDIDFEEIIELIYYESSQEDLNYIIKIFNTGLRTFEELQEIVKLITEAWNYFPHKTLGGKSPVQML